MKIEESIAQLLYRYQCVTVPGFGAFLTEIQSAKLHEMSYSFYPPKKLVSFNPYLKNNDGLLANHIAQTEKTSYETAVTLIQTEVENWKNKLRENGMLSIKNIGEITLNIDKNLVFIPSEQINYLATSFGLSSFVSPSVKREVYKTPFEEVVEEKAPIEITLHKKKSYSLLKYAAVFVIATGIGGGVGYNYYVNKIAAETLAVQTKVQKEVQNKIQEATFFISNPIPAVTLTVKEEVLNYHIVAGAFRQEQNAQKALLELQQKGFKARRIGINKYGLYPVLYGSYATYADAKKAMTDIQKTENHDAWMLIEEL